MEFNSPNKVIKKKELVLGFTTSSAKAMYDLVEEHAFYAASPFAFHQVRKTKDKNPAEGCTYSFHCNAFKVIAARNEQAKQSREDQNRPLLLLPQEEEEEVCGCTWLVGVKLRRGKKKGDIHKVVVFEPKHGPHCMMPPRASPSLKFLLGVSPIKAYAGVKSHKNNELINYVERNYKWILTSQSAGQLIDAVREEQGGEDNIGYKGIQAWLLRFKELNPAAEIHYDEDPITGEFISMGILFPCKELFEHSFGRTLYFDGGFVKTKAGVRAQLFYLVIADRNKRSIAIGCGVFPEESLKNYKVFLAMPMRVSAIAAVLNSTVRRCAAIHDRHLSMKPATAACYPILLDRTDVIHIGRNIKVSQLS